MAASPNNTAAVIAGDLRCASCGYNLRTLAVAGRCPECGQPVAMSLTSQPFRFGNPSTPKRVRNGLAVFIVGVLFSTILTLVYVAELRLMYVLPENLLRMTVPATAHAIAWIPVLMTIGLILATWPFGRRGDRFVWPLGVAVAVLAVLGISRGTTGLAIRCLRWLLTNGSDDPTSMLWMVAGTACGCAHFLAPTLAWIYLLARVRYRRNRALWFAMSTVVLVQLLLFASSVSSLATLIAATKYVSVSGGTLTYFGPALKSITLGSLLGLAPHQIVGTASLVTVAALWLYLRRLQRVAERGPAVPVRGPSESRSRGARGG